MMCCSVDLHVKIVLGYFSLEPTDETEVKVQTAERTLNMAVCAGTSLRN
ncbi:MAG: hypothetical protein ACTS4V_01550 [Candidatus Hodgkinia cicadicola]